MGDRSKIEWTDATWNPIIGCSRVSEGCRHCYAETTAARFSGEGQYYEGVAIKEAGKPGRWTGAVKLMADKLDSPLRWKKPRRIFVNSMSDLFHEGLDFEVIAAVFAVMARAAWHTFQVLTKRPGRALKFSRWLTGRASEAWERYDPDASPSYGYRLALESLLGDRVRPLTLDEPAGAAGWPLPNVWLGVSIENQKTADERVPILLQMPAAVRWVSYEPALGPVDLQPFLERCKANRDGECSSPSCPQLRDGEPRRSGRSCPIENWGDEEDDLPPLLDWVVAGGESGPGARPAHPDWFRRLRDCCRAAEVPFLFKQWGNWGYLPELTGQDGEPQMGRMGKRAAGRQLDGRVHDEYPAVQS